MLSSHEEYVHSGKLGSGPLMVSIGGLLGAIVLSIAYAYIDVYSPIAGYISILFVGGFAVGLGFLVSYLGKASKCRSKGFLSLSGFAVGLFALYVSWVVFLYALFNRFGEEEISLVNMLFNPVGIWEAILALNATGWYSIKGSTISGGVLWFFWGIEALIVMGVPVLLSGNKIESEVFCETCDQWCEAKQDIHLAPVEDDDIMNKLAKGDLDFMAKMPPTTTDYLPRFTVETKQCKSCANTQAFQVTVITEKIDKEGKTSEDTNNVSNILLLSRTHFDTLQQLATRPVAE